jgi:hypothetical protein
MKKRIFAISALVLSLGGIFAGVTATPAAAQDCEIITVWLTINGVLAPTELLCI